MNHNAFLKEFINMRKEAAPVQMAHDKLPKKKGSDTKKKAALKAAPHVENGGLQHIIENKPPRKEVIEYLQNRANHYTIEKMA
jgi:hypothetical protein